MDERQQPSTSFESEVRRVSGSVTPSLKGKGRKKLRSPATWKKNVNKETKYCAKSLPKLPTCKHLNRSDFHCSELTMQGIRKFHQLIYPTTIDHTKMKLQQDNVVLKYTITETPKRDRCRGDRKQTTQIWTKYFMPITRDGVRKQVQVCQQAFLSISGLKKKRIQRICRDHFATGECAQEKRGGDHRSHLHEAKKIAVKKYIETLVPLESHYCRNTKTNKQYLDSTLTIIKRHDLYNSSCSVELKVNYEYFRNISISEYNLSFDTPATDCCSKCIQYEERLKMDKNNVNLQLEFVSQK